VLTAWACVHGVAQQGGQRKGGGGGDVVVLCRRGCVRVYSDARVRPFGRGFALHCPTYHVNVRLADEGVVVPGVHLCDLAQQIQGRGRVLRNIT
jgi:hypothetical protein